MRHESELEIRAVSLSVIMACSRHRYGFSHISGQAGQTLRKSQNEYMKAFVANFVKLLLSSASDVTAREPNVPEMSICSTVE
jgi:hypothetical protein